MRMQVPSLALLSGLGIQRCPELWCRMQMRLGSGVAVAVVQAGSNSSDSAANLGTSICHGGGPKKKKKKKKKKKEEAGHRELKKGSTIGYVEGWVSGTQG